MARVIKLKESDITNMVRRILSEEKRKKTKKPSAREIMKGKITKDQGMKVMKKYNLLGSMKSLVSGYKRMYNMSPKWVQEDSQHQLSYKRK